MGNNQDQLESILDESVNNAKKTGKNSDPPGGKAANKKGNEKSSGSTSSSGKSTSAVVTGNTPPASSKDPPLVSMDTLSKALAGNFKQLGEGFHKSIMEMGEKIKGQFSELRGINPE